MKTVSAVVLASILVLGCGKSSSEKPTTNESDDKPRATKPNQGKKSMTQELWKDGNQVGSIEADGEVWIGGNKVGSLEANGDIWVEGNQVGSLAKDGTVWKGGDSVGSITAKGEVWKDGDQVGTVEKDGDIWFGSSRDGSFVGGKPEHAAVFFFYGFFDEFLQ